VKGSVIQNCEWTLWWRGERIWTETRGRDGAAVSVPVGRAVGVGGVLSVLCIVWSAGGGLACGASVNVSQRTCHPLFLSLLVSVCSVDVGRGPPCPCPWAALVDCRDREDSHILYRYRI